MEKSNLSGSKIIAIILLIILLLGLGYFAVIDGIRERTSEIFHSVVSLLDHSADILRRAKNLILFWQYTAPGDGENGVFVYLIDNEDINGIAENKTGVRTGLINQSVEMDNIGLDSTIIKEMDVVFNASKGTTSTLVLAELGLVYKYDANGNKIQGNPENDVLDAEGYILDDNEILKVTNPQQYIEQFKLQNTERANQILKKYSSDNMETEDKKIGGRKYTLHYFKDATGVRSKLFWFQVTSLFDDQFGEENFGKIYLGAFGVIHIQNALGEEMVYRDHNSLEELIQVYMSSQGKLREEAVKEAIEQSYGMTDIGTIYVYNWDSLKEYTKYQFKDEDAIKSEPEITLLDETSTQTIELEDILNYSKFTIPVELTTDLLNITGSDEFADVFLNYALNKTDIIIKLFKQESIKTTYLAKQYDIIPSQFFLEIYHFDEEEIFERYRDIVVGRTYNGVEIEVGGIKSIAEQEMGEAGAENDSINSAIATTRNYLNGIESRIINILNSTYPDYGKLITLIDTEQDNGNIGGYDIYSVLNSIGWYQQYIRNLDIDGNVENCESAIQALEYLKSYVEGLRGEIYKLYDLTERLRAYEHSQNADSGLQNWIANNRDDIQAIRSRLYNYSRDDGIIDQHIERKQRVYEEWRFGKDLEDALLLENQGNDGNGTNKYTVTETKIDRAVSVSFAPFVKSINTWFATTTYEDPQQMTEYTIKKGQTDVVSETEYNEYDTLDQYICDENLIVGSELSERRIDFTPETVEKKEGYGVSGVTDNKLWFNRYESIDPTKSENYENLTIKNLAEEVAVTGEAYNPDYNKSSTNSDYIYTKFNKNDKRAYDGERTRTEHYEMGTIVAQTVEERDAKIKEFLSLLKNTEGTITGCADGYNSEGKVVEYDDIYFSKAKVGNLLENGAEMLFQLLESSESTSGLADVFRYIMYIYTGIDYGVTSLDFYSFNRTWSYSGDTTTQFIMAWENSFIHEYLNGTRSYDSIVRQYITQDKKFYIVYYEDRSSTWNFSYGINIGDTGEPETAGGDYSELFPNNELKMPSKYRQKGAQAEVEKLDKVYRDDIARHKNEVMATLTRYGITLSDTQIDALVSIKYQYGNIDGVNDAWIASNNGADLNKFKDAFWVSTSSGGRAYPFKTNIYGGREQANWKLFSEGKYTDSNGNEIQMRAAGSGDIIDIAEKVHTYMEKNGYTYGHRNGGTPEGMRNQRVANCISYVTWVYCEAGYIDEIYTQCTTFEDAIYGKYNGLFERIYSYDELQAGDIMYFGNSDHAEIYAGDGYSYNAGNPKAIKRDEPTYKGKYRDGMSFSYGYRIKQ